MATAAGGTEAMDQTPAPSGSGVNGRGSNQRGPGGFVPPALPPPIPARTAESIRTERLDACLQTEDAGARNFVLGVKDGFMDMAGEHVKSDARFEAIERGLNDAHREQYKYKMRVWGTYLPKDMRGQDLRTIFIDAALVKHGIVVKPDDIGNVYLGPKNSLVVTLIHVGQGTSYDKLLYRHSNAQGWQGAEGVDVCFEHFLTPQDRQLWDELLFLRKTDKNKYGNNTNAQRQQWRVFSTGMSRSGALGYSRFLAYGPSEMLEVNTPNDVKRLMTPEERANYEERLAKRAVDKAEGEEKRRNERANKSARRARQRRGPLGGPGQGHGGGRQRGGNSNLVNLGQRSGTVPLLNSQQQQQPQHPQQPQQPQQQETRPYSSVASSRPSAEGVAHNEAQRQAHERMQGLHLQSEAGRGRGAGSGSARKNKR